MFTEKVAPHLNNLSISIRMPEVIAVNLAWIASLYNHLQNAKSNVRYVELNTYDLDKADTLETSIRLIEEVIQSLNKVVSNPKKYTLTI